MVNDFLLAFIPIFVAVDPIGVLPIFLGLSEGLEKSKKKKVIYQSLLTAFCLAFGFIFLGKAVFKFLGIAMSDFMIAGGIILFCIAVLDIVNPTKARRMPAEDFGPVPIGTPLIAGPAVLTSSLMLVDQYGLQVTGLAVLSNIIIVGILFFSAEHIMKVLGEAGTRALSKVMALLLAAIAVMMIRRGIFEIFGL